LSEFWSHRALAFSDLASRYRPSANSTAFWIAKASDSVIGDLPVSFRQTVLWCHLSKRANFDCPPVPRSSSSESQMARRAAGA
jgi:hypothetical protein